MVGGLAALTRLEPFALNYHLRYFPMVKGEGDQIHPTLAVLLALTEYLEDLVARIDAPQADDIRIWVEEVQTRQRSQFIGRTAKLSQFGHVELVIDCAEACIKFDHPQCGCLQGRMSLTILGPEESSTVPCMIHVRSTCPYAPQRGTSLRPWEASTISFKITVRCDSMCRGIGYHSSAHSVLWRRCM